MASQSMKCRISILLFLLAGPTEAFVSPSPYSSLTRAAASNQVNLFSPLPISNNESRGALKMSTVASDGTSEPMFEGIGVGIKRDLKERLPFYKSDIKDGLNTQVRSLCSI